jgi:uncharacterized protein YdeI (BOF family)
MFNKLKILKMKKIKFLLVALFAVFGFSYASAAAPAVGGTWTDDNFSYTIKAVDLVAKTGTITIAPNGTLSGVVTIPGSVKKKYDDDIYTFTMDEIPAEAFKDQVDVTKVNFPAELTSIGASAFQGCTLLAEITFAANSQLTSIGTKAFATTQIVNPDFTNCVVLPSLPDLLFTDGVFTNSYVQTIKFPKSAVFTTFGTALADLPKLKTANIAETKIQIVKAGAFDGTSAFYATEDPATNGIRSVELPATVKSIEADAFENSLISNLTINVDAIKEKTAGTGIGDGTASLYGTSAAVLTKLILKGELKGRVAANAFLDNTGLTEVDMSAMSFNSKGQIETNAFSGCTELTKVTMGDISHNGYSGEYTVNNAAFNGCVKLATVVIGKIDTKGAIGQGAFGAKLTSLTIGNIEKAGAIAGDAFVFDDANTTVTIGTVLNEDPASTTKVFGAAAFKFAATGTKTVNVTIGNGTKAIDSKGGIFTKFTFTGTKITNLTFNGAIVEKGLDVPFVNVLWDAEGSLTFNGTIETGGIVATVFQNQDINGLKTVNFTKELAPGAVADYAFGIGSAYAAANVPLMTVNYTSATHANTTASGIPFGQKTFKGSYTADRDIKLVVTNKALAATIISLQAEDATDVIYRVMLVPEDPTNFFNVYNDNANDGTSYARILLQAGKKYQIDRRPVGEDADGVDQTGITYNLYVCYKEEDDASKTTLLNMLPMVSTDGYYYVDVPAGQDLVVLVKATKTKAEDNNVTKMWYEEITAIPAGKQVANVYNGDGSMKKASAVVTNQQLRDGSGDPLPYVTTDPKFTISDALDNAKLTANNVYLLTNPEKFGGLKAVAIDYETYTTPFINKENFYALGKKYPTAARMIFNWLDESDATAIYSVKTGKAVNAESDAIYNLQGIRVNKAQKGIYIQNGKKIVVR